MHRCSTEVKSKGLFLGGKVTREKVTAVERKVLTGQHFSDESKHQNLPSRRRTASGRLSSLYRDTGAPLGAGPKPSQQKK
jgi:hypothetical protein